MIDRITDELGAAAADYHDILVNCGMGLLMGALFAWLPFIVMAMAALFYEPMGEAFRNPRLNSHLREFVPRYYPATKYSPDGTWIKETPPHVSNDAAMASWKGMFWLGIHATYALAIAGAALMAVCLLLGLLDGDLYRTICRAVLTIRQAQEEIVGTTATIGIVGSLLNYPMAGMVTLATFCTPGTALFTGPVRWIFFVAGIGVNLATLISFWILLLLVGLPFTWWFFSHFVEIIESWTILAIFPAFGVLTVVAFGYLALKLTWRNLLNALCIGAGIVTWLWSWLPGASLLRRVYGPKPPLKLLQEDDDSDEPLMDEALPQLPELPQLSGNRTGPVSYYVGYEEPDGYTLLDHQGQSCWIPDIESFESAESFGTNRDQAVSVALEHGALIFRCRHEGLAWQMEVESEHLELHYLLLRHFPPPNKGRQESSLSLPDEVHGECGVHMPPSEPSIYVVGYKKGADYVLLNPDGDFEPIDDLKDLWLVQQFQDFEAAEALALEHNATIFEVWQKGTRTLLVPLEPKALS